MPYLWGGVKTINNVPIEGSGDVTLEQIGAQPAGEYITDGNYSLAGVDDYFVRGRNKEWIMKSPSLKRIPNILSLNNGDKETQIVTLFGSREAIETLIDEIRSNTVTTYLFRNKNIYNQWELHTCSVCSSLNANLEKEVTFFVLIKLGEYIKYTRIRIYENVLGKFECDRTDENIVTDLKLSTINNNSLLEGGNLEVGASYIPTDVIYLTNESTSDEIKSAWYKPILPDVLNDFQANTPKCVFNQRENTNVFSCINTDLNTMSAIATFSFTIMMPDFTFKKFEFGIDRATTGNPMTCKVTTASLTPNVL